MRYDFERTGMASEVISHMPQILYNYEMYDQHNYTRELSLSNDNPDIPSVLGEFGGIGYYIEGHTKKYEEYGSYGPDVTSGDEFLDEYRKLMLQMVKFRDEQRLCAAFF